jgi:hypothetical protein
VCLAAHLNVVGIVLYSVVFGFLVLVAAQYVSTLDRRSRRFSPSRDDDDLDVTRRRLGADDSA